jgi:hypothetical protein
MLLRTYFETVGASTTVLYAYFEHLKWTGFLGICSPLCPVGTGTIISAIHIYLR